MDDSYAEQVTTYALAALRSGAPAIEIAYAFLEDAEVGRRAAVHGRRCAGPRGRAAHGDRRDQGGPLPGPPGAALPGVPGARPALRRPALEWEG